MHSDRLWQQSSLSSTSPPSLPCSPKTLHLPPSIPISLDGEEGAYAYNQQLLQSNADVKLECYQPPPNRTIANIDKRPYHKGALPLLPSEHSDYVSSSLLSSWRSASSDRTMLRETGSSSVACARHQQQPRSSSADSVRRLVKRFFVRKLTKIPTTQTSHDSTQTVVDNCDAAAGSLKLAKDMAESHWDLPPNYVDMIFTRDPITKETRSDVVEKGGN